MKLRNIGLQFFADGDPVTAPTPTAGLEPSLEKTFTQAELDSIVGKRIAKAMKGMPAEDELTAFRAWKESQQTEKERWNSLTKERDESKTALAAVHEELEQYKREKFLIGKGVNPEDVDYFAFKIGKLVTDTVDFEKAAEQFLEKEKPSRTMRVDFSAPVGSGKQNLTPSEQMNNIFRNFRK